MQPAHGVAPLPRPKTIRNASDPSTVELICQLRDQLQAHGMDAGPHTICWHVPQQGITTSPATVWRHRGGILRGRLRGAGQ